MTEKGEISNFHLLPNLLMETLWHVELGVGYNTPGIIKYPFWQMTDAWPKAKYVCLNAGDASAPGAIKKKSICINEDTRNILLLRMNRRHQHNVR